MSLTLASFLLAFCFSLNRNRVFRIFGFASVVLLLIQEDGLGRVVSLCTAGIWFSDLLERGLRDRPFIASLSARAAPLALTLVSASDGSATHLNVDELSFQPEPVSTSLAERVLHVIEQAQHPFE